MPLCLSGSYQKFLYFRSVNHGTSWIKHRCWRVSWRDVLQEGKESNFLCHFIQFFRFPSATLIVENNSRVILWHPKKQKSYSLIHSQVNHQRVVGVGKRMWPDMEDSWRRFFSASCKIAKLCICRLVTALACIIIAVEGVLCLSQQSWPHGAVI